ncbi:hypothetical protein Nepgr_001839 [Nepenthes gracilis]|uniref:Uncharacterized protein n=1 Tax=Nepenthes gracilis TaxID=150966 RepID=A0AAD3P341_NEPGR|nr:hypothetical protein Nepgr_001839 [Nepenthes gracilis]
MGNALTHRCCKPPHKTNVKLVFCEGTTRTLTAKKIAGELMEEYPDCTVLHADSFFVGRRIPALAAEEELVLGQTYFVIPNHSLPCNSVLSISLLNALMIPTPGRPARPAVFGDLVPFEHIKGENGRLLIKVVPEFIMRLLTKGEDLTRDGDAGNMSPLICSTPELKRQYDQLVRTKEQVWSPKLETISEQKIRFLPGRFIRLERIKRTENVN